MINNKIVSFVVTTCSYQLPVLYYLVTKFPSQPQDSQPQGLKNKGSIYTQEKEQEKVANRWQNI